MRIVEITNPRAAKAYADYLSACQSRPQNEATIETLRAALAAVIEAEAEAGHPAAGREIEAGHNRHGQPVTRSGMKPGTPFAIIGRPVISGKRRRIELCKVWPNGDCDSAGPACFTV